MKNICFNLFKSIYLKKNNLLLELFLLLRSSSQGSSSLGSSSLSRQHGSNFLVDCFILSLYFAKYFISFSLVLFIDSWKDKDDDPGDGEKGEAVEEGSDEGGDIQDSSKLGRVKIILHKTKPSQLCSGCVKTFNSWSKEGFNIFTRDSQVHHLYLGKRIFAWLLESSHEVDIHLAAHAEEEEGEGEVGDD